MSSGDVTACTYIRADQDLVRMPAVALMKGRSPTDSPLETHHASQIEGRAVLWSKSGIWTLVGAMEALPNVIRQELSAAGFATWQSDEGLRDFTESIAQHIDEVFFWRDPDSLTPYFVSHSYERIWGQPCESAYADPSSWTESIHPKIAIA